MRKTFILLAMVAAVFSCNSNKSASNDERTDNGAGTGTGPGTASAPETRPAVDITKDPAYKQGLALIGKSDCLTCHKVSEKVVGPAYVDVAKRYAGKPGIEDSLANKVIRGGAGNWGEVPMTPHANLSREDAVTMVKYILLLNQQ